VVLKDFAGNAIMWTRSAFSEAGPPETLKKGDAIGKAVWS